MTDSELRESHPVKVGLRQFLKNPGILLLGLRESHPVKVGLRPGYDTGNSSTSLRESHPVKVGLRQIAFDCTLSVLHPQRITSS